MSILLDTHVFIWAAVDSDKQLSSAAAAILNDPDQRVFFSSISALEIAIKWSKGNIELPIPPLEFINKTLDFAGISQLAVTVKDACAVGDLPFHHRDPFDRLLVVQARTNNLRRSEERRV